MSKRDANWSTRATSMAGRSPLHCFIPIARINDYLGGSFSWILSGNILYSLCQWLFVVVLAKLGTPEDVGGYALGLAITSPVLVFANFQARNLVASDVQDEYSFGEYMGFRITSLALTLVVVLAIIPFTKSSWPVATVIFFVGLGQAFDWVSETYFGLMQKHDRLDRVAQSLMLKGPLCLLFLTAAMYFTRNLVLATAALALGRGLILWRFDAKKAAMIAGPVQPIWNQTILTRLLTAALPLGVISGLVAFNLNIPRYFIEADLSKRDLGIFSAIASLVGAGHLVMSALASCSFVALAKAWAARDVALYRSLSLRLFAIGALLGGAGVLAASVAGDKILALLFRPEYGGSARVFARIMLAGALGYIISGQGYAITAARNLRPQIPLLLSTAAIISLCSWWLVPVHGLEGAADAWLLGSLFQLAGGTFIMARMANGMATLQADVPGTQTVPVTTP